MEDENISYSLSYEDKALISINENIRIIALKDTIDAIYNIDNGILTLTTSEKETDEFYGFTSILKYKKKNPNFENRDSFHRTRKDNKHSD